MRFAADRAGAAALLLSARQGEGRLLLPESCARSIVGHSRGFPMSLPGLPLRRRRKRSRHSTDKRFGGIVSRQ